MSADGRQGAGAARRTGSALAGAALAAALLCASLVAGTPAASGEYNLSQPPQTTITKAPKKVVKTKAKRVRVTFRFRADDARATFRCRVLGAGKKLARFQRCEAPARYRLKAARKQGRKYVFEVRARSRSGIDEMTPQRHAFRVRRR